MKVLSTAVKANFSTPKRQSFESCGRKFLTTLWQIYEVLVIDIQIWLQQTDTLSINSLWTLTCARPGDVHSQCSPTNNVQTTAKWVNTTYELMNDYGYGFEKREHARSKRKFSVKIEPLSGLRVALQKCSPHMNEKSGFLVGRNNGFRSSSIY